MKTIAFLVFILAGPFCLAAPPERASEQGELAPLIAEGAGKIEVGDFPLDLRTETSTHDAELFCLGDNQPASKDGRDWSAPRMDRAGSCARCRTG